APVRPVIRHRSAAKNLYKRAAKRSDRRAYSNGDHYVYACVAKGSEPNRASQKTQDARRAQQGHHAVRRECDEVLRQRHPHSDFCNNMGGKGRSKVDPPSGSWSKKQRAEEKDVGGPERSEYPVG